MALIVGDDQKNKIMRVKVIRYNDTGNETLGLLYINGKYKCFTLEDEHRDVKVFGETRIPNGIYRLGIRTVGGFHARYTERFEWHKGMIEVLNVPNFKHILIHVGNIDSDTSGCLLVGELATKTTLGNSVKAYREIYEHIIEELLVGNYVDIEYKNLDV